MNVLFDWRRRHRRHSHHRPPGRPRRVPADERRPGAPPRPGRRVGRGRRGDYEAVRPHFEDQDAVVHLAHAPIEGGGPSDRSIGAFEGHLANLEIHANAYAAAVDAGVDTFVYASSNHAVGLYEVEHAPDVYFPDYDLTVDHTVQPRPDSMYGVEKVYAEGLRSAGRRGSRYAGVRAPICAVRGPRVRPPYYGDAEAGVDRGEFDATATPTTTRSPG